MNFNQFKKNLRDNLEVPKMKERLPSPEFSPFSYFKILLHEQLIEEFGTNGKWLIDHEMKSNQWDVIIDEVIDHTGVRWDSDPVNFIRNLSKGTANTKLAFAFYYWLHTWHKKDEQNIDTRPTFKERACKLDQLLFENTPKEFLDVSTVTTIDNNKKVVRSLRNETLLSPKTIQQFQQQLEFLSQNYFEREEINTQVEEFLNANDKGVLTIEGEAGTGKSALMASLVRRYKDKQHYNCAWHFITWRSGSNRTAHFIQGLLQQLETIYDLTDFKHQNGDGKTLNEYEIMPYFNALFDTVSFQTDITSNQKLLIVIDALDEVASDDTSKINDNYNTFFIPRTLPPHIYIIISSRDFNRQIYSEPNESIALQDHNADVRGYISHQLKNKTIETWASEHKLSDKAFVDLLWERSEQRFIYLFYVFKSINHYEETEDLPHGLNKYYAVEYERFFEGKKDAKVQVKFVLAAISNFRPDISWRRLCVYCDLTGEKLDELIADWLKICLIVQEQEAGLVFYRFSHLSFYEFIEKHKQEALASSKHSLEAHERLANLLNRALYIDKNTQNVKFNVSPLKLRDESLRLICDVNIKAEELPTAAQLLVNLSFCQKYLFGNDSRRTFLISLLQRTFDAYVGRGDKDLAHQLAKGFFNNILRPKETPYTIENFAFIAGKFQNDFVYMVFKLMKNRVDKTKKIESIQTLVEDLRAETQQVKATLRNDVNSEIALKEFHDQYQYLNGIYARLSSDTDYDFVLKDLAILEYEIAYVYFLRNEFTEALKYFLKSKESAHKIDDYVGVEIANSHIIRSNCYTGELALEGAYNSMTQCLQILLNKGAPQHRESFFTEWVSSINEFLFQLSVEMENQELAEKHLNFVVNLSITKDNLDNYQRYQIHHYMHAYFAFVTQRYTDALMEFCSYLELPNRDTDQQKVKFNYDYGLMKEISRDYLYFGLTLRKLGRNDEAKEVFNKGLAMIPQNANKYYQDKIREELTRF